MTDLRLSAREAEDVLAGRQPAGRADLAPLAEVAAVLHASREVEPAPPMSDGLRAQIDRGLTVRRLPVRGRKHRPQHLRQVTTPRTGLVAYRRPLVSVAAAAAVLVGLVTATSVHLPGNVHSAVADVGSAIGLDLFRSEDAAGSDTSSAATSSTTTAPTTTSPPPSTTAPLPASPPEAGPHSADGHGAAWWTSPEVWRQFGLDGDSDRDRDGDPPGRDRERDRDGDGDGDGQGTSDGGDGRTSSVRPGDGGGEDEVGAPVPDAAATTMLPTSTSTSTSSSSTTTSSSTPPPTMS
jgi:hypothetical protein